MSSAASLKLIDIHEVRLPHLARGTVTKGELPTESAQRQAASRIHQAAAYFLRKPGRDDDFGTVVKSFECKGWKRETGVLIRQTGCLTF